MPDSGDPNPAAPKVLFGKYELGRLLGRGASAKVYSAWDITANRHVAIKVIPKQRLGTDGGVNVAREVSIMRRLRHPHVVRLHEVLASRTRVYFVMELLEGGELFARLDAGGRVNEDQCRQYFRQLVSAVGYCHSRGVFHRDLKPENLLLDDYGDLKISDFGLSSSSKIPLLHTLCGTPAYVAPEILGKRGYHGARVDVWSLGVVLFVLAAGYLPFNDSNLMNLYRKIYRGEYKCPEWTSPELRRLINRLLVTDPEERITVEEIVRDPWFLKGLSDEEVAELALFRGAEEEYEDDEIDTQISKSTAEKEERREMNAFDLISFSSGFDLSGLFDSMPDLDRFVLTAPAETVLRRTEELSQAEGWVARRAKGKKGHLRNSVVLEGYDGNFVARVGVYHLAGDLVVVEVDKGPVERGGRFWREWLGAEADQRKPVVNRQEPVFPGVTKSAQDIT